MRVLVVLRRRRLRRLVAAWGTAALVLACRPGHGQGSTTTPVYLGDFRGNGPTEVAPAYADDWHALQDALARDPAADEVRAAADRLLAAGPPLELRMWAIQARARHAYALGHDTEAIQMTDQILAAAAAAGDGSPDAISALSLSRVRSMIRSGDPARGLVLLEEPALAREGVVVPLERAALQAIGLDRAGRHPEALVQYAQWRAMIETEDAAAAFAERRLGALATSIGRAAVAERAGSQRGAARQCLDALAGTAPAGEVPPWVERCRAEPLRIGMLLPRTGPLAALADTQLAAAEVALDQLSARAPGLVDVLWQDSGSDADGAAAGAAALVAAGANVIVGPLGAANVRAAKARIGDAARLVTPGEPVAEVGGAAPSLERRVAALVDVARSHGAQRVVVLVPDNGYGRRVTAAAADRATQVGFAKPKSFTYAETTTSFAPTTDPLLKSLSPKVAIVIGDQIARTELLLRQLARDGKGPGTKGGPLVLATAEGISESAASVGHEVLGGLFVAPTATASGEGQAFAEAYARRQGEPAPDHALLVFRALALALDGGAQASAQPVVIVRVQGGKLVVEDAPTG